MTDEQARKEYLYGVIRDLNAKIDAQAASLAKKDAEIERLGAALDEIAAKARKLSEFPNFITSYDMRKISDIARAARDGKREVDNE